jgi:4-hydroxy-3-polyprenylbenzoate decarboxylase
MDPSIEVGAVADRVMKTGGPALLFEKVGQSPFPLLINGFGSRSRMAAALSQPDLDAPAREIERLLHAKPGATLGDFAKLVALLPELASIPPRRATTGRCQDVVLRGDDVDLGRLPVLTTWPKDGGPFITLPLVITRDPESGVRNVGCYRMLVRDANSTAMHWHVHNTGAGHFRLAK